MKRIFFFVAVVLLFPRTGFAQVCSGGLTCNGPGVYNPNTQQYDYTIYSCQVVGRSCNTYQTSQSPTGHSNTPPNTSCIGWLCDSGYSPHGTNTGYYHIIPTPTPGAGRCPQGDNQGYCFGRATNICCTLYNGQCCGRIPSGCKTRMGCSTGGNTTIGDPTNGGGPTSCNLYCPQSATSWSGSLNGNSQTNTSSGASTDQDRTIVPPVAETQLTFQGQNGFSCGTLDDGTGNPHSCSAANGANPGAVGNITSSFYAPVRYHMLCGALDQKYTASVVENAGGASGGGVATPVPTNPAGPLYPIGCNPNAPTPTVAPTIAPGLAGMTPNPTAGFGIAPTRVPGSSVPNSCSCSVTLGCQRQLYPVVTGAGSTCDNSCNLSVNPDNPVYNTAVSFGITGNASSLNFDDNSSPVSNPSGSVSHTFVNAGVYDVSLSCGAQTCTKRMNVYCTYIPKNWYKLKDASFHKISLLQNPIPDPISAYDSDDTTTRQFSIGQGGLISADAGINLGTGAPSTNEWIKADYTFNHRFDPSTYLEYVTARKHFVTVTPSGNTIDGNDITQDAINVANGNFEIDSPSIQSNSPFVLIVNGDLTISRDINPPEKSLAIFVLGTLKITSGVTEVSGLFFANSVDLASDITTGNTTSNTLKINGNLVSTVIADTSKRVNSDIRKPSYFIVFKPEMYTDLLPLLSIRSYEWTQLAN